MQHPRFLPSLRVLSATAILPLLVVPAPADTTCTKKSLCRSITEFSVYTGEEEVVPCGITQPIVQIESRAFCGNLMTDGSALLLRCGTTSTPFSYTGAVAIHSFSTSSTWGNVLNGACGAFSYSAMYW